MHLQRLVQSAQTLHQIKGDTGVPSDLSPLDVISKVKSITAVGLMTGRHAFGWLVGWLVWNGTPGVAASLAR